MERASSTLSQCSNKHFQTFKYTLSHFSKKHFQHFQINTSMVSFAFVKKIEDSGHLGQGTTIFFQNSKFSRAPFCKVQ